VHDLLAEPVAAVGNDAPHGDGEVAVTRVAGDGGGEVRVREAGVGQAVTEGIGDRNFRLVVAAATDEDSRAVSDVARFAWEVQVGRVVCSRRGVD